MHPMVPSEGVEPSRPEGHSVLSAARLHSATTVVSGWRELNSLFPVGSRACGRKHLTRVVWDQGIEPRTPEGPVLQTGAANQYLT